MPRRVRATAFVRQNLPRHLTLVNGQNEENVNRCTWAARNLLELHYWTRYVISSAENTRRFHEDAMCDVHDLLKKLEQCAQFAPYAKPGRASTEHLWQRMQEVDKNSRFLKVSDIARGFREEAVFENANKFLSKFVHPTSISIQMKKILELKPLLLPAILQTAAFLIESTFPPLSEHIRTVKLD